MKDGSIVETFKGMGSWTDSRVSEETIIKAPIDLDEADYVQFGSQQIKID